MECCDGFSRPSKIRAATALQPLGTFFKDSTSASTNNNACRLHVAQKLSEKRIHPNLLKFKTSLAVGHSAACHGPNAAAASLARGITKHVPESTAFCVSAEHASNERVNESEKLRHYLASAPAKKLPSETLITLYESVRIGTQLKTLSAVHLSTLISILGASSLPPDAPRVRRNHVHGVSHTSYWSQVLCIAEDKKALGFLLNEGDHYWAMWAWIARYRFDKDAQVCLASSLSLASIHYRQIWRKTRYPDILIPYFEALLSTGDLEHFNTAVADLCSILGVHSNLHGRSLKLLWDLFLSVPIALTTPMEKDLLEALWKRTTMSHTVVQRSHYMATHMFDPLTKRHQRLPLAIPHLVASLGAPLFPFFRIPVPLSVQQWARRQLSAALSPSCANDLRWTNFSLFALSQVIHNGSNSRTSILDPNSVGFHFNDWHAVLTLSILENVTNSHMSIFQESEVRSILGALWERWLRIETERPIYVSRAVISSFLRLAARTQDNDILDQCYRYAMNHALWDSNLNHTAADRAQIDALVGHYLEAFVLCHGKRWTDILDFFDAQKGLSISGSHADFVIRKFLSLDVGITYEFYEFCASHNVPVGADITTMLAINLAPTRLHDVFSMLECGLDHLQLERVLIALLDTLRTQRYQYLTLTSGRILGRVLRNFLQSRAPSTRMKYALRYAISRLVVSNCAADAIRIVELLNERVPSFLNSRFLQRLLGIFLRYRQFRFAARLYHVLKSKSVTSQNRFRRMLIRGLIKGGASALVRRYRSSGSTSSTLERIFSRLDYRGPVPYRRTSDRALSIIRKNPSDIPSIKYAFAALVLSKRPVAAKRLFQSSLPYLDPPTKNWFGNMFLHRILRRFDKRNIQVVKKLLRAKNYLMANFGFTGDRVTYNILMKGMLRWRNVSITRARMLFDDCIRMGYPAGSRWRRFNDVPFGTQSPVSPLTFGISALDPQISFQRHIRPLYKMFIKAFYLRKDVEAAKTVIGILKSEEAENLLRQQHRDRSRLERFQKAQLNKRKSK
ncbi:hypothetical protein F5050DRAFT_1693048 [Lentinula boryana]|uniref:Uncharacterized protein n=1 Tax=Lentinula boryana TaxID=40481 RepID=A0ABQ8QCI1_9AGAR|nr:hypothetical protein F5050DRAFT_1693048 [Lentinula boryana]